MSADGYVYEGHVPARYVQEFLSAPPANAIVLSVPAMPMGSPGMEYQNRFDPYKVLLLMKDGSSQVYANITNLERSEVHTSELQSRPHLVCRLLLEKKNNITITH